MTMRMVTDLRAAVETQVCEKTATTEFSNYRMASTLL